MRTYYVNDFDLENIRLAERQQFIEIQRESRRRRAETKRKKRLDRYTRTAGLLIMIISISLSLSGIFENANGQQDATAMIFFFLCGLFLMIGKFGRSHERRRAKAI